MQTIKFNVYRKKDGTIMLFANNDRRVSVGISEEYGVPAPYGKRTTAGQRNLIEAIGWALKDAEPTEVGGTPDFEAHTEDKARLEIGDLYITDVATIGGVSTGADGAFLITNGYGGVEAGKVINLSQHIKVK